MTDEASTEIPADAEAVAAGAGIASDPPLGEPEAPKSAREIMDAELSKIEAAKDEEPKPKAEPTPEKGFYYRSDHFSFAKLGVPMFNFGSGDDLVEGGVEAGKKAAEDYEKNRYHAPGDEYEAITNWDGMMSDLRLYYAAGRMLAMTDAWPNWVEGDEFRAARDKSRAGK